MSLRRASDGGYFFLRPTASNIEEFNRDFLKIKDRWYPKNTIGLSLIDFLDTRKGEELTIVGKGPSLDAIKEWHYGPVLCINDSCVIARNRWNFEPQYIMQFDGRLKEICSPVSPMTTLLVGEGAMGFYADAKYKRYYTSQTFGVPKGIPTVIHAMHFAKVLGCRRVRLVGFDFYGAYASGLQLPIKTRGMGVERFKRHAEMVENCSKDLRLEICFQSLSLDESSSPKF